MGLDECLCEDFRWTNVHGLSPELQCSEVSQTNLVEEDAEQKFFVQI